MPTPQDLLRQVPFFGRLDDPTLTRIAGQTRRRRFGAHEALFHEGDPGQTLYLIVSGLISIQRPTASGQTLHLAQRGPGEHFGELALIDGRPRMADAVTLTPCEVMILDRAGFEACIASSPPLALAVMASLAERLREAAVDLEGVRSLDVLGRLARALLALAAAQEGSPGDVPTGAVRLDLTLSRQDLADRIGTTRESVSRALSRLCRLKAVESVSRSCLLLYPVTLRHYCDP